MLVGYNDNITYKGKVYHVQTEDSGIKNPVIITLLYYKGTILSSKKTDYSHLIESPDMKNTVREVMKAQHKAMLHELHEGKHTKEEPHHEAAAKHSNISQEASTSHHQPKPAAQQKKSLDDILLDYITQKEKTH
jgi:hypothetical protein